MSKGRYQERRRQMYERRRDNEDRMRSKLYLEQMEAELAETRAAADRARESAKMPMVPAPPEVGPTQAELVAELEGAIDGLPSWRPTYSQPEVSAPEPETGPEMVELNPDWVKARDEGPGSADFRKFAKQRKRKGLADLIQR